MILEILYKGEVILEIPVFKRMVKDFSELQLAVKVESKIHKCEDYMVDNIPYAPIIIENPLSFGKFVPGRNVSISFIEKRMGGLK